MHAGTRSANFSSARIYRSYQFERTLWVQVQIVEVIMKLAAAFVLLASVAVASGRPPLMLPGIIHSQHEKTDSFRRPYLQRRIKSCCLSFHMLCFCRVPIPRGRHSTII